MDQPSSSVIPVRGSFTLFGDAWKTYKQHFKHIIIFQLVVFLVYSGGIFLLGIGGLGSLFAFLTPFTAQQNTSAQPVPMLIAGGALVFLFIVVAIVFSAWMGTSQSIFYWGLAQGKLVELGSAFTQGVKRFLGFLWVGFLVGIIGLAGLLLFVVPGVIWGIRFFFAPFIYIAEGVRGRAALRRSWELTRGVSWVVLARWYALVVIGALLSILQMIPLVGPLLLVPFVITPLMALAFWYFFVEFDRLKQQTPTYIAPYGVGKKALLVLPLFLSVLIFFGSVGAFIMLVWQAPTTPS